QMDGRGPWGLEESIREHQKVMSWYGKRNIPVEVNEPHHWGLRDASDVTFVVAAYLSAYNAQAFGVRDYIAQMMFNSPPGLSDAMDLAKMLACLEIIEPLAGPDFHIWRQTRTGLLSYPVDIDAARAHLAASVYLQMALRPHILHVVGHTEAHHAATAHDVVEACKLARRAIENALQGQPDMTAAPAVQQRKEELIHEAQITLEAIRALDGPDVTDPLTDPNTLARSVTMGILDAPHLRNNPFGRGQVVTRIDQQGACNAVNPATGQELSEQKRIDSLNIGCITTSDS
ncbi:MAG: methionine synthase, partial [Chloroflexota bacterium]|nr:methionine synthase [Chloroflexota bacterium]